MDYKFCNIFKEVPYFPRVYKTLMEKFSIISKIGLYKNNASHSIVATRPITMLSKMA
jgi:hypothetical protein